MKKIEDCDYKERLLRTLLVIEGVCLTKDPEDKLASQIYTICHGGMNLCNNPHEDWVKEINELQNSLAENNVVDIDKTLERKQSKCNTGNILD